MKKYLVMALMASLILGFQNCAKSPIDSTNQSQSSIESANSKIDTDGADLSSVESLSIPNEIRKTQIREASEFEVNLASGEIRAITPEGKEVPDQKFCLSSSDLAELKTIMDSAKLCVPKNEVPPDQMCTMIFSQAYVRLQSHDGDVSLGEVRNGCEKPIDLCGEHASMFRGYITALINNLKTKICD